MAQSSCPPSENAGVQSSSPQFLGIPAAKWSYPPLLDNPLVVVNPQFCAPDHVDLAIVRKFLTITGGDFTVTDSMDNVMFKIRGKFFSLRERRVLLDGDGTPILTLKEKLFTAHRRWKVYRGESTNDEDLLFSAKKSSIVQLKTKLHVFLAANKTEDVCDFMVEDSWSKGSCSIFLGDSSTIIAKMRKKTTLQSVVLGKDKFGITVPPNVDYAFVVALVVLLEGINQSRTSKTKVIVNTLRLDPFNVLGV